MPDEVADVAMVLWENYTKIFHLFSYYSSMNSELSHMTLNTYLQLVADCKLASKTSRFCRPSDLDTIFIMVDSVKDNASAEEAKMLASISAGSAAGLGSVKDLAGCNVSMAGVSDRKHALGRVEVSWHPSRANMLSSVPLLCVMRMQYPILTPHGRLFASSSLPR